MISRSFAAVAVAAVAAGSAFAQGSLPGVSPTEIRIGQTMPYSGPASAFGSVGRAAGAYFAKINKEEGGVNGRKIVFLSLDDGYSPPKTFEMTRRLVEQDDVLLIFGTLGTPTNTSIHKYLNAKGVPQLFITTGADKWADPKNFPWTMPGMVSYQTEGAIYARHLIATKPGAKVALLYQNDDFGKDYVAGFRRALGERAKEMVVAEATYEVTDATIDSQIVALKSTGAEALFGVTVGKFTSQMIRRVYDIGWRPEFFFVPTSATSIKNFLEPAGLDKSIGLITAGHRKSMDDPQWADDPAVKGYYAFMKEYLPEANPNDTSHLQGYDGAMLLVRVLKQAGNDLSRKNVMAQAANLKNVALPTFLPGIALETGPDDYLPVQQMRLQRFDGKSWVQFGDIISDRH
jgi:branched-chain amino acid transport system substrate-binding protein